MHKSSWQIRKIILNIKKKKYKAMLRYFFDPSYRAQVDHMIATVKAQPVDCVDSNLRLGDITHGHPINYPDWISQLRLKIRTDGYLSLDPIKVIWDESKEKYLIVDGNHRYAAMLKELPTSQRIPVKLLIRKDERRLSL